MRRCRAAPLVASSGNATDGLRMILWLDHACDLCQKARDGEHYINLKWQISNFRFQKLTIMILPSSLVALSGRAPDAGPTAPLSEALTLLPPSSLVSLLKGWPGLVAYCARGTSTVLSCAFREHRGPTRPPSSRFHHFQSGVEFVPAGHASNAIRFDGKFV